MRTLHFRVDPRTTRFPILLSLALSFTAIGCGDTATTDAGADATPDVAPDATPDVAPDRPADAPADATPDAAAASCGTSTCMPTEICVRQRTLGGAFLPPDDAGMCPAGRHVEGASCVSDFAYRCAARPTCTAADCACLGMVCPSSFMCRGVEAAQVTCEQLAP